MAAATGVGGAEVRLDGLTKTYGAVVAVDGVSLTVAGASFFTLLGPSGSGKTTTLMMIAGFVWPDAGTIAIDGRSVTGLAPQKRDLGVVFQSYAVFPHLTVEENLAFPLDVRRIPSRESRRRVGDMLELVRLRGYEGRLPRQLSGGEQQRVALARALIFQPRVLLMDEPLGALDKKLRTHMQLELKQIQEQVGVTVIYVTHDQEEALTMSSRVAVMQRGRVEQVGTPADLYERPRSRFVADFLGESNLLAGTVVTAAVSGRCVVRTDAGLTISGVAAEPLREAQRVMCAVRPERLTIGEGEADDLNRCKGAVAESVYVGDVTRHRVSVDGCGMLNVKVLNARGGSAVGNGDCLPLSWSPADTRVFPDDAHSA